MDRKKIQDLINKNIKLTGTETVDILKSIGKVNALDIYAKIDIPNYTKAKYDGFALTKRDCDKLRKNRIINLKLTGDVGAGHIAKKTLLSGTTIYLMTGAEVPPEAYYIVPCEMAEIQNQMVHMKDINLGLKTIAHKGEVFKKGAIIIKQNTLIDRKEIFDITNQGYDRLKVYKSPKISIISTGDEVKKVGQTPLKGEIFNSTSYAIAADVMKSGGEILGIDHSQDNLESIIEKINQYYEKSDIIITTGGIGSGKYDYTKLIHNHLSTKIIYSELDKAPRIVISKLSDTWIINLSGSPRATFISLDLVVNPIILGMMGLKFV